MSIVAAAVVRNVAAPMPCPAAPAGAPIEDAGDCTFWRDYANLPQYAPAPARRPSSLKLPEVPQPSWLERGRDAVLDFLTDLVQ